MTHSYFPGNSSLVPAIDTGLSKRGEALLLAIVLTGGLTFVTPLLSLFVGVPTLALVALTGAGYAALALFLRRTVVSIYVALIVTVTFAANVPLASTGEFVGHLGPQLWLVQLPLAGAVAFLVADLFADNPRDFDPSTPGLLFGGFVVWSFLAAIFGATARTDAALYFAWFVLQGLAAFAVTHHAVRIDIIRLRTLVETFLVVVAAQTAVAVVQFFHGGLLGLSRLGESAHIPISPVSLGPLGEFATGTYVAGFTGMSFILATLIVLAVPIAIVLALRTDGWRRWGLVAIVIVMAAVLRMTGSDAARGGIVVAALALAGLTLAVYGMPPKRNGRALVKRYVVIAALTLVSAAALFYPSASSGTGSHLTDLSGNDGGTDATGGGGGGNAGGDAPTQPTGGPDIEAILRDLTIPLFDIGTLGIRLQQYITGIELFIQYPLFGIGGANFPYYATARGLPKEIPLHNIYIALLAETGLPGFLLYVGAVAAVLWMGWRAIASTADSLDRALLVGVLAGMIGYLAFAFWDTLMLTKVAGLFSFWILAGGVVGHARRQPFESERG
ncbi:O-antigen ligase family protein [Halococcus saccharolyticus]|uniref:Polysaccharide deacetylase n=1 Tax=Halococcus saccharolyticus DSM 5350 TaxID=1227455 RepID=M0MA79_9EURY|nr:O-antigen ligase family protein [Halococcus saccharolyticus]EMA42651.1 polysaccharide deacetylase [Halococcus saccharolyticus DSM 5350]